MEVLSAWNLGPLTLKFEDCLKVMHALSSKSHLYPLVSTYAAGLHRASIYIKPNKDDAEVELTVSARNPGCGVECEHTYTLNLGCRVLGGAAASLYVYVLCYLQRKDATRSLIKGP